MIAIVDFNDFAENNNKWWLIQRIKDEIPNFRVTLFAPLGRCSMEFIDTIRRYDWVDICPHGWLHSNAPLDNLDWTRVSAYECAHWTEKDVLKYIEMIEPFKVSKIFKAPGWRLSTPAYKTFIEQGFIIADIQDNHLKWEDRSKIYVHPANSIEISNNVEKFSCHIQNLWEKEGLVRRWRELLPLKDYKFVFIKEYCHG